MRRCPKPDVALMLAPTRDSYCVGKAIGETKTKGRWRLDKTGTRLNLLLPMEENARGINRPPTIKCNHVQNRAAALFFPGAHIPRNGLKILTQRLMLYAQK